MATPLLTLESHNLQAAQRTRRAALVSNLLVVLCSESEAHPVVRADSTWARLTATKTGDKIDLPDYDRRGAQTLFTPALSFP